MSEVKSLNIYQRINEVRKVVSYVQKDAKVTNYKAVTHDNVTASLRAAMVEHGIVMSQSMISSSFEATGQETNGGAKYHLYQASYNIKFINIDEPSDILEVTTEAQALDHGDKAIGKAMSYAIKYAMLKTFSLETGEDEEGRQEDIKQKREAKELISLEQAGEIETLLEVTDSDKDKFLAYFNINEIAEITAGNFRQVKNSLQSKLEKLD